MSTESIDLIFSFDTTGSMYPCLTQVRRQVEQTVKRLFIDIPNIRIGIIAHGDYCDGPDVIAKFDLSTDQNAICRFVRNVRPTFGGDAPEAYELALHEARTFSWTSGRTKALVLIGDDVPHGPNYPQNTKKLDWRNELGLLMESNIHVYAVQALARRHATSFYKEVAKATGGYHLQLNQFADVVNLLLAVAYKQQGSEQLYKFEQEVQGSGRLSRDMLHTFATLGGKARKTSTKRPSSYRARDLAAVHPSRFQMMFVDHDQDVRDYVEDQGVKFRPGRGFYEFTKSVKVQHHKEVVLQDKETGDMFTGKRAREILNLPDGVTKSIAPSKMPKVFDQYRAFIQSTSWNRRLLGGTAFLYEVEDWDRAAAA
jgi:hypothetical protein